jgi:hypothetical protein
MILSRIKYTTHIWEYSPQNENRKNRERERERERKKRKYVKTLKKYHILYKMNKNGLHVNGTYIDVYNPIFEAVQEV